uniref:DNA-directed RNA polymerase subunit beta' n=1 Tax=Enhalus acoroides TaxID=55455 RepID=A0A6M3QJA6_9LILI|nr:RNA polymerase beta' subunit [Enhalus acoroides]QJC59066.1 RNA polymerase beta' subunit [Enhalus acoroides]UWV91936.1 RNA polymerase beta' subunit [Enhalus acoroides]
MIDWYKHQQLRIGSVSPEKIRSWANKILPNGEIVGEVKNPFTFHHQTNKPEKNGLFCEKIFGPMQSGICACGKIIRENKYTKFCKKCGVEFVDSRIRRYQMGYIQLARPKTHVWYLKRFPSDLPSYIANLLDQSLEELEGLVYCDIRTYLDFYFARPITSKPTLLRLRRGFFRDQRGFFRDQTQSEKNSISSFFSILGFEPLRNREISIGASAIRAQLANLNLRILIENSLVEWEELRKEEFHTRNKKALRKIRRRKRFLVRRMQLAKHFLRNNVKPEWMVLSLLPVLPPELRPMIEITTGKVVTSDLNAIYRTILSRNNTLRKMIKIQQVVPRQVLMCQERLVQEAVDALFVHGRLKDINNRVYKCFSDIIESGKEGRFRQTLLGKRVDYSGRSVIVVGPSLSLHQCGLPREIAIELFQTFVIRGLIRQHVASNIGIAKSQIREKKPIVWEILQEVLQGYPVLLNRAPTLHRLGIQAFQPILVKGRAISLHPLVCKGFNADFDGDQMGVHIPLSLEAQAEARLLMFSNMNLLSPTIGNPICVPTQDMLIGLYILTVGNHRGIRINRYNTWNRKKYPNKIVDNPNYKYTKEKEEPYVSFSSSYDALGAYRQKRIHFNSPLWLRWRLDQRVIGSKEVPIEVQYESLGTYHEIYKNYLIVRSLKKEICCIYIRTTVGHISFYRETEEAIQGFYRVRQRKERMTRDP